MYVKQQTVVATKSGAGTPRLCKKCVKTQTPNVPKTKDRVSNSLLFILFSFSYIFFVGRAYDVQGCPRSEHEITVVW